MAMGAIVAVGLAFLAMLLSAVGFACTALTILIENNRAKQGEGAIIWYEKCQNQIKHENIAEAVPSGNT